MGALRCLCVMAPLPSPLPSRLQCWAVVAVLCHRGAGALPLTPPLASSVDDGVLAGGGVLSGLCADPGSAGGAQKGFDGGKKDARLRFRSPLVPGWKAKEGEIGAV